MAERKSAFLKELRELTNEIKNSFSSEDNVENIKWSLLKTYHFKYLLRKDFRTDVTASYVTVLSVLLDALQPTLFRKKWQETLFDDTFLQGIQHESFIILVKRLAQSEKFVLKKITNLLLKFLRSPAFEALLVYQCTNHDDWNLKYVTKSIIWDDLITSIISVPERMSNKTNGKFIKIFSPSSYVSLLLSSICKVLSIIYKRIKNSQDSSLEFLAKLTGKICLTGNADMVAKKFSKELIGVAELDYIWRRISQSFVSKMPSNTLDSFVTNLLLEISWYGYVEIILGNEGIKNENLNYIMTVKLLFFRPFKQVTILQNTIGYFASSHQRLSHFNKILNSLLDSWADERALKHQSIEQKTYIASALMICAGWLRQLQFDFNKKDYINKVLKGTCIRLGSSEVTVRTLGMIVGEHLIKSLDPDSPPMEFECVNDGLVNHLKCLLEIPLKPDDNIIGTADFKCLEEIEIQGEEENISGENVSKVLTENEELDSDDDLEPCDMPSHISKLNVKRPMYIRDCIKGLLEQDNTEQCMKHAEALIKANPYATEEVAEEMTKIMLHLTDSSSVADFIALRHRILIALTMQCPLTVATFLVSQFTEKNYTIRQRLDILEVLGASSAALSYSNINQLASSTNTNGDIVKKEPSWQIIINQRLEGKTKKYTKAQKLSLKENTFSAVVGHFFYPLLNAYGKACKILKFHEDDSYILGRFICTLGIIVCSASNSLICGDMGVTLLQFLSTFQSHSDVFVRQSTIFAMAATFTAVPSYLLLADMLPDVTDATEWLQNVAQNDPDSNCIEKALYTLSLLQNSATEDSLLYQLKTLASSN